MKRHDFELGEHFYGQPRVDEREASDGEWVRFEDVEAREAYWHIHVWYATDAGTMVAPRYVCAGCGTLFGGTK